MKLVPNLLDIYGQEKWRLRIEHSPEKKTTCMSLKGILYLHLFYSDIFKRSNHEKCKNKMFLLYKPSVI